MSLLQREAPDQPTSGQRWRRGNSVYLVEEQHLSRLFLLESSLLTRVAIFHKSHYWLTCEKCCGTSPKHGELMMPFLSCLHVKHTVFIQAEQTCRPLKVDNNAELHAVHAWRSAGFSRILTLTGVEKYSALTNIDLCVSDVTQAYTGDLMWAVWGCDGMSWRRKPGSKQDSRG